MLSYMTVNLEWSYGTEGPGSTPRGSGHRRGAWIAPLVDRAPHARRIDASLCLRGAPLFFLSHQGSETAYKTAPGVPRIKRPPKKPTEKEKKRSREKSSRGMDSHVGKFFDSVGSIFRGSDTLPWCDRDIIAVSFPTPSSSPSSSWTLGSALRVDPCLALVWPFLFPRFVSGCFVVAANFLWNVRALANWRF